MVEDIEDLGPELDAVTLLNSPVLVHREIKVLAGRHSYDPATQGAECTQRRPAECCRVEIVDPIVKVNGYPRDEVGPLRRLGFQSSGVGAGSYVDGGTAQEAGNRI